MHLSGGHWVKVFTSLSFLSRRLSLVQSQGRQILSGLSAEDHMALLHMIKRAILATDLTVYMKYFKTENVKVAVGQALCLFCFTPDNLYLLVFLGKEKRSILSCQETQSELEE